MDITPDMFTKCWNFPSEIIEDKVYLSNMKIAEDLEQLQSNQITHILTVACDIPPKFPEMFQYKVVDIEDVD